jgi:hypothetical protein
MRPGLRIGTKVQITTDTRPTDADDPTGALERHGWFRDKALDRQVRHGQQVPEKGQPPHLTTGSTKGRKKETPPSARWVELMGYPVLELLLMTSSSLTQRLRGPPERYPELRGSLSDAALIAYSRPEHRYEEVGP